MDTQAKLAGGDVAMSSEVDRTKFLSPFALAVVLLCSTAPVLASATGAGSTYSGLVGADGLHFSTYGPSPTVGSGVRSLTHTRAYVYRAAYHFNGVGFSTFDTQSQNRLAFQVSDDAGNYIYHLTSPTYTPGAVVSAATWRNFGGNWHFNWWGDTFNVGVNADNTSGAYNIQEAAVGVDGWGGCENVYPANTIWNWFSRNRYDGNWYSFPQAQNYNWGTTPTWWITGNFLSIGSISFGTTSCP